MENIVFLEPNKIDSEPFTTSDVIAESAGIKHHAIQQLIFKHEADFKEFGVFAFEMRKPPTGSKGGRPETIYHLNEQQATLLMTYLKNTERVRAFKKELVRQFYAMRQEILKRQTGRAELKPIRRELTDVIKEQEPEDKWAYKMTLQQSKGLLKSSTPQDMCCLKTPLRMIPKPCLPIWKGWYGTWYHRHIQTCKTVPRD